MSSFQLHFADHDILTPGDRPDVLVAMNPAALKANLGDLPKGGTVIVDTHDFTTRALARIGWATNPIEDGTLDSFNVHALDLTQLTLDALSESGLSRKDAGRSKNMFALGLAVVDVFAHRPRAPCSSCAEVRQEAGDRRGQHPAFKAGWNYGETTEAFAVATRSSRRTLPSGTYRNITGNLALAYGLIAAAQRGEAAAVPRRVPDHAGQRHPARAVQAQAVRGRTFQAEDEIAGIGCRDRGVLRWRAGRDHVLGPGIALKSEAIGLAVSLELPLVVIDIQRGGPSTGLPTKTEQSDLLQAMFGRNGEAPVPIIAAQSPGDCFDAAIEAVRIAHHLPHAGVPALRRLHRQRLRAVAGPAGRRAARDQRCEFATEPNGTARTRRVPALPARPRDAGPTVGHPRHRRPGAPHRRHREGRPHRQHLLRPREPRLHGPHPPGQDRRHRPSIPTPTRRRPRRRRDRCWCSAGGRPTAPIGAAVRRVRKAGYSIAQAHLRHLNPFPSNLGEILDRYDKVVLPEMNLGQLALLIRAKYLVDIISVTQVRGMPFRAAELAEMLQGVLDQ